MAASLSCPYCAASFTLSEWSRTACCPGCGRRVTFFEASGQDGASDGPAVPAMADGGSALPAGATPAPVGKQGSPRTFMGKPLVWTRAWTVVVTIWVVFALLLLGVRVGLGDVGMVDPSDQAARDAVPRTLMPDGKTTYGDAVDVAVDRMSFDREVFRQVGRQWYVLPRPWEDRVYILLELTDDQGGSMLLGWWVEDGKVTADPPTLGFLEAVTAPGAERETIPIPSEPTFLEQAGAMLSRVAPGYEAAGSGGAKPRRSVFSVTTRGSTNCSR